MAFEVFSNLTLIFTESIAPHLAIPCPSPSENLRPTPAIGINFRENGDYPVVISAILISRCSAALLAIVIQRQFLGVLTDL